jgi:anti-sigma regulatory factor (Ser/Thr protein kinase)
MREITVAAVTNSISKVTAFVDEELARIGCDAKANAQIDICIDEIFANIANYAYGTEAGDVLVRLEFGKTERLVSLTFIDAGMPFDPRDAPDPDITSPLEERPIGGLGLFMVRKLTDSMSYRREDGHNILTIHKRI